MKRLLMILAFSVVTVSGVLAFSLSDQSIILDRRGTGSVEVMNVYDSEISIETESTCSEVKIYPGKVVLGVKENQKFRVKVKKEDIEKIKGRECRVYFKFFQPESLTGTVEDETGNSSKIDVRVQFRVGIPVKVETR